MTVTSVGNQDGAFEASLGVSEAVNETAESPGRIETTESSDEFDPGSSATVEFEGVTGGLEEGNYTVEIVTENDSTSGDPAVEADGSDEDESDGGDDSPPEDADEFLAGSIPILLLILALLLGAVLFTATRYLQD